MKLEAFHAGHWRNRAVAVPLYLVNHGLLAKPSLYLSDFFERNRSGYYDALTRVRTSNDLAQWIRFFLRGVAETATKGCGVFRQILQLNDEVEQKVRNLGRRTSLAHKALQVFYRRPVLTAEELQNALQITRDSSYRVAKLLVKEGLIEADDSDRRCHRYCFGSYLKLFLV